MPLPILPSVEHVLAHGRHVRMHAERIAAAVCDWGALLAPSQSWDHPCHFNDHTEETLRWIFTLDVLNHCFWPDPGEPVWTVRFEGEFHSGYWGLAASLKRAFLTGVPITDPEYLAAIGEEDLRFIFAGEGEIPLLRERLQNLREAGRVILSRLGGDIAKLVLDASGSAVRLVSDLAALFPSFRDETLYRGRPVYFWKRAQIFASDLHAAFGGKSWGEFNDMGDLTAFADYKLPQVLRELGVISYDAGLGARIDGFEYLLPGSCEEVEIRAATIAAVEAIRAEFQRAGREVDSTEVDNWLWRLGQMDAFRKRPYHRCRTIYY